MSRSNLPQCPLCYGPLEVIDVTPCYVCGHFPKEVAEFGVRDREYAEYTILGGLRLVLCALDMLEFTQYRPDYFGLPVGKKLRDRDLVLVHRLGTPSLGRDQYCPDCQYRLAFLRFIQAARDKHGTSTEEQG